MPKSMLKAPVLAVTPVARQMVRLTLQTPAWAKVATAGHFVNVLIPDHEELLWRRPFSVHRVDRRQGTLDLLFAAAGRGSQVLARCRKGDTLDVIGLLGNTFPITPDAREIIMVAGGIGIAPFDLLLQDAAACPYKKSLFYGAHSDEFLYHSDFWPGSGVELHLSTDDGSAGQRGTVLQNLEEYLQGNQNFSGRIIYSCGPTPMLAALRDMALRYGIKTFVTLENLMACGFGACVGCPVELARPQEDGPAYLLACKDGPVFPVEEIVIRG